MPRILKDIYTDLLSLGTSGFSIWHYGRVWIFRVGYSEVVARSDQGKFLDKYYIGDGDA
jgi:hypothetical protein